MDIVSNLPLKKRCRLWSLAALLSCCWGSGFLLNEIALQTVPVWWIISSRIILAAGLSSLSYIIVYKGLPPVYHKKGLVLGVVGNLLPFWFITTGQQDLSAGLTSLLASTVPVFTVLLSFLFLKKRFRLLELVGIAIIIFGIYWLFRHDLHGENTVAILWVLAGVFCYGVVNVYGALQTEQSDRYNGLELTTMMLNTAAIPLLFISLYQSWQQGFPAHDRDSVLAIISLAVLPTMLAALLFFYLLKQGGALLASIAGSMVPVSVVLLSVMFMGAVLSTSFFVALMLIVIGGLLTIR